MAVIALDLGGTKLASAILSSGGEILFTETVLLDGREGQAVGQLIVSQVNQALEKAIEIKTEVTALGICVPGIAHANTGRVWAPNIPGWDDYPLMEELKSNIQDKKVRVRIDSDRACYILAETWKGKTKGCLDAIFLGVGTGIGAGIMINGEILRGAHDIAGAIGWMALDRPYDEKYIPCGCFEYHASGEGLVRVAKELMAGTELNSPLFHDSNGAVTARDLFEAYDSGDPLAVKVMDNAIQFWGMAVANLVSLFNPEKIIFGGGVFGPALKFLDRIYDEAKKWAQPVSIKQVVLEGTALGAEAGLYGAGYLALKD